MLLDNSQFSEQLFSAISGCEQSFVAFSAFIKITALKDHKFTEYLAGREVVIVARWKKHDLLSGASDLEVYQLCKEKGWRFGIDLNLHGKLFLIDNNHIFLGSANLTQRGLHIGLAGNHEFGTMISAAQADIEKIDSFIESEVTWMDDNLFDMLSDEIEQAKREQIPISSTPWSREVDEAVSKPVEFLWVRELLFSTPADLLCLNLRDEKVAHDFELLGLNIDDISEEALKSAFKRQRLYRWMCSVLKKESLSFGAVSARLHKSILDDPRPYRVDIKNYNQILFKWAELLANDFTVSQPNYSQVLSLS